MDKETKLVRRADLITADMDGSAVTMDVITGAYYNMGEVGGAIWNLLEHERTFGQLVDALCAEFQVEPAECEADTAEFVEQLVAKGLLLAS